MLNRMQELMERRKLTEEGLETLTGISQANINRIKNGKRIPKVDTALRIARALKVPVERIWSLSNHKAA